jgi:hypothetical protein
MGASVCLAFPDCHTAKHTAAYLATFSYTFSLANWEFCVRQKMDNSGCPLIQTWCMGIWSRPSSSFVCKWIGC